LRVKNLFLTGEVGVGKSTIVRSLIYAHYSEQNVGGFKTVPYMEDGELKGYSISEYTAGLDTLNSGYIVGVNIGGGHRKKCIGRPEVFESIGVEILENCLEKHPEIIVMDELGFFESEAENFKRRVYDVLDGNTQVLGVLKKRKTQFLDSVKNRKDVLVLEVDKNNRDSLKEEIEKYWGL
jgi:nucleoside-triphosphatase